MSNETEVEDKEEKELREKIEQLAEAEKVKAEDTPHPDPAPEPYAPTKPEDDPVTQPESKPETKVEGSDDPMEWAKKKGFKTPEDMARALLQKEHEFHQSRQKAPEREALPPPAPAWNPTPDMGRGYPPQTAYPPQSRRPNYREIAAMYPQLLPEDVERVMPLILDTANVIARQEVLEIEKKYAQIARTTQRNNELMTLMQDPAFRNERVQREIHSVLDSDPTIFQREPERALTIAYEKAMVNLARQQLQKGISEDILHGKPPTTAGGGNGSARTVPIKITEKMFDSWSEQEQEAFLKRGVIPKRLSS